MSNSLVISQVQKQTEIFYFVCAAIAPVLFSVLWLLVNMQLPASDATQYLTTAHLIYQHFVDDGVISGVVHSITERGWRPIFFPVLSVPFLLISHGSVMFAYNAVAVFCILTSVIYVYLYLRLYLDRLSACIGANLICLLPFVQMPALIFVAEAALFPVIIGSLYHLIQSDYFRRPKHAIGFVICLSLALLIRPIETATDLFFVLITFIAIGGYQRIFSLNQIMTVIAISLSTLFLFLFFIISKFMNHYPLHPFNDVYDVSFAQSLYKFSGLTLTCLLFVGASLIFINSVPWYRDRWHQNGRSLYTPPIIIVFGIISVICLLWFLPYAFPTYQWIFQASMGDIADISLKAAPKLSTWQVVYSFLTEEGVVTSIGIVFIALLGLVTLERNKIRDVIMSPAFIWLFLLIPFPVWEVLNTCQTEPRKLGLAFSGLLMALLLIGLKQSKLWLFRFIIIFLLLIAQFVHAVDIIYSKLSHSNISTSMYGNYLRPITIQPNPHDVVMKFLDSQVEKYQIKNVVLEMSWEYPLPVYPYLLMMMSKETYHPYNLSYLFFSVYSDTLAQQLSISNDAVFLIDKQSKMVISDSAAEAYHTHYLNEINPALKNWYHFLHYYSQNKLNNLGWKLGPCISFKASDENQYLGCLLISVKKSI